MGASAAFAHPRPVSLPLHINLLSAKSWTLADFDGDLRSDIAVSQAGIGNLIHTDYTVDVQLSGNLEKTSFTLTSDAQGLDITPRDVDGDHDLDLVITARFSGKRIGVWVNDGHGKFSEGSLTEYPESIWTEPSSVLGPLVVSDPRQCAEVASGTASLFQETGDGAPALHVNRFLLSTGSRVGALPCLDVDCIRPPPVIL